MLVEFHDLATDIRQCRLCEPDLPLGANPVFQAHPDAKILVAGQAPGIRVHKSGIPFNDPSGDRLRLWMGLDREQFYNAGLVALVPMGFCYPGTGKSGDLPPRPECAQTWHRSLLATLPAIALTIVIGQYAHRYYLGKNRKPTLTETVRSWQNYGPEMLPLPHPSPRNNIWLKNNTWFECEVVPVLQCRVAALLD